MDEISLKYDSISPGRKEVTTRIQLISASLGIVGGYSESLNIYTGVFVVLPVTGFGIALLNILCVIL